jgi:hypothetical protein
MKGNFTLIRSKELSTKLCPKCKEVEIFSNVGFCGKCFIEEITESLPSGSDAKIVLEFPDRSTKEAA